MLKSRKLLSAFIALSLLSQVAFAKNNLSDWNNVRILDIGTTIVVKTKAGERYEGRLKKVEADSLAVVVEVSRAMRRVIDIRRDEVKQIRTKLSRTASVVVGTAVGVGVGITLGAIADSKDRYGEDPGLGKSVGALLGLLFGSIAGTGLSLSGRKVYEAP
jgi:small nuclear ribonucleoprotein (snRNP)-like protein